MPLAGRFGGLRPNINTEIIQLKGKAAILKKNVEEVSANLIDLEKNTEAMFKITADEITLSSNRLIVNKRIDDIGALADGSNAVENGWYDYDGKWYYLGTDCAMATGLRVIDGKAYYFHENGAMAFHRLRLLSPAFPIFQSEKWPERRSCWSRMGMEC